MPLVNGTLTDFGLDPLTLAAPVLLFRASSTGLAGLNLLSARKAVEVVPAENGFFEADLVATTLIAPETTHYTVEIRYRDTGTGMMVSEILPWKLLVPPEGGTLGDLLRVPANPGLVWTGTEPPLAASPGTWWLDPETGDLTELAGDSSTWTYKANLIGPAGYNATDAAQDDAAIAAFIESAVGTTATKTALDAAIGEQLDNALGPLSEPGIDNGEAFASKKDLRTGDYSAAIAGDSTGNAADEAFDLYIAAVAAADPDLRAEIPHWNDATQAYSAATLVQAGNPGQVGVVFSDLFNRTADDLYGTVPDLGGAWGRDGSNAAGDWSLDGAKAVRTADATQGTMLADGGTAGDMKVTVTGTISTNSTGTARNFRIYFSYLNSSNSCYLNLGVSTTGASSWTLQKRINGVATTVATGVPAAVLATNTAGQAYTIVVERVGTVLNCSINGTTLTGNITAEDAALLDPATIAGISGGVMQGDTLESFTVEITEASPARVLRFYNASMPGSTLVYHQARLAAMYPNPVDVLFINSCHNYGPKTPAQYEAELDTFIAAFRNLHPQAGIVICSQNPQKPPAAGRAAHLARLAALRSYCARHGYGYVPVIEAFKAQPDGGLSLVAADGVHPTTGAAGSGASLWRDTIIDYFNNL